MISLYIARQLDDENYKAYAWKLDCVIYSARGPTAYYQAKRFRESYTARRPLSFPRLIYRALFDTYTQYGAWNTSCTSGRIILYLMEHLRNLLLLLLLRSYGIKLTIVVPILQIRRNKCVTKRWAEQVPRIVYGSTIFKLPSLIYRALFDAYAVWCIWNTSCTSGRNILCLMEHLRNLLLLRSYGVAL